MKLKKKKINYKNFKIKQKASLVSLILKKEIAKNINKLLKKFVDAMIFKFNILYFECCLFIQIEININ